MKKVALERTLVPKRLKHIYLPLATLQKRLTD
jgi:hypothetical protein